MTRKDVAEYAGVSKTTVTRVISNKGYVSGENRRKVENAIAVLGYRPNLIARSLKTRQSKQLLFYTPDLTNPFYMEVYQGMEDYVVQQGYTIVVTRNYTLDMVRERQFDGVILACMPPAGGEGLSKADFPVVVTDYSGEALDIPSVGIDIVGGAEQAMDYLRRNGHSRIAFITGPDSTKEQRYRGYVKGLDKFGQPAEKYVIRVGTWEGSYYEMGYRAALELLGSSTDVSAVFAFNDAMAIGAMAALQEKGVRIPGDISVIGFDDILQSRFTSPPLTTIHMPKYEQGWESAKMLIRAIEGEPVQKMTLETNLVIRDSVKGIG